MMIRSASRALIRSMKVARVSSLFHLAARARAANGPSLLPSSRSPTPTYQVSCPPRAAALASRVVVYSSTSVSTSLTRNASLMPPRLPRRGR